MMFKRCQYNAGKKRIEDQCALPEGHDGRHKCHWDFEYERRRNQNPTLDSIREVVLEELAKALTAQQQGEEP